MEPCAYVPFFHPEAPFLGKEFGDLIFLRHHVSHTDLCVEEKIEPLCPQKRQRSLVLMVLDLMAFTS